MIVAGFGFREGAGIASLQAALASATRRHPMPDAIATLRHKAAQLAPLARALALPLISLDPEALEDLPTLTRSPASLTAHRVGSVAEAAALAAAGPGARLLSARHVSPDHRATCALAESTSP